MIRNRMTENNSPEGTNEAERLIETALVANVMLRLGRAMIDVTALLGYSLEYCETALAFYSTNDATKLRALVEDWPLAAIKRKCVFVKDAPSTLA